MSAMILDAGNSTISTLMLAMAGHWELTSAGSLPNY